MKNLLVAIFSLLVFNLLQANSTEPSPSCKQATRTQSVEQAIAICEASLRHVRSSTLAQQTNSQDIADIQLLIANLYKKQGQTQLAMEKLSQVKLSESFVKTISVQYQWYRQMGLLYLHQNQLEEAFDYLNAAYNIAKAENNIEWLAKSSNDLGLNLHKQRQYNEALEKYKESLAYKEKIGNLFYIATTFNNLGLINKDIGDYSSAIHYYQLALDRFVAYTETENFSTRVFSNMAHLYEDLAVIYSLSQQTEKRDHYAQLVIETFSEKASPQERVRAFKNLANAYASHNDVSTASRFLNEAQLLLAQSPSYLDEITYLQAKIAWLTKDNKTAIADARKAIPLAEETGNVQLLHDIHWLLFQVFRQSKQLDDAFYHLSQVHTLKSQLLERQYQADLGIVNQQIENERIARTLLQERFESEKKDNEIQVLILYSSLITLLIILIGSLLAFVLYRKRKEKEQLLKAIADHKEKYFLLTNDSTESFDSDFSENDLNESDLSESNTIENDEEEMLRQNDKKDAREPVDAKILGFKKSGQANHNETTSKELTDHDLFRETLVDLMIDGVALWEKSTQTDKVELAEKSKIWKVSIDSGRLRTRSLDKYLNLSKCPLHPRWKNVVKTAHFILSECELESSERSHFNAKLEQLMHLVKQSALDPSKAPPCKVAMSS